MIRRFLLVALMALSFFAAPQGTRAEDPLPECDPCPWGEPPPRP